MCDYYTHVTYILLLCLRVDPRKVSGLNIKLTFTINETATFTNVHVHLAGSITLKWMVKVNYEEVQVLKEILMI